VFVSENTLTSNVVPGCPISDAILEIFRAQIDTWVTLMHCGVSLLKQRFITVIKIELNPFSATTNKNVILWKCLN
jgi:hypothetical protein